MGDVIKQIAALVGAAGATNLALAAFLAIAVAGLCYRFFAGSPLWAKLATFFAVLIFAFLLIVKLITPIPNPPPPESKGSLSFAALFRILPSVAPDQRFDTCMGWKNTDEEFCKLLVKGNADIPQQTTPKVVEASITNAVETKSGQSAKDLIRIARSIPSTTPRVVSLGTTVTMGNSKGYDVDVFWCDAGNKSTFLVAEQIAKILAQQTTTSIAPGVSVGRVRILPSDAATLGISRLGSGVFLSKNETPGNTDATNGVAALLNGRMGLSAKMTDFGKSLKWYLSLAVC